MLSNLSKKNLRRLIFDRDGNCCLCCDSTVSLQVDHIKPKRSGGKDTFDNWQTLCRLCNVGKRAREMSFLETKSHRTSKDKYFPLLRPPLGATPLYLKDEWIQYIQRTMNLHYYCRAVKDLNIVNQSGLYEKIWQITLLAGNDPYLIQHHLVTLQKRVCWTFERYVLQAPKQIAVTLPNQVTVVSTRQFEKFVIPDFSL